MPGPRSGPAEVSATPAANPLSALATLLPLQSAHALAVFGSGA